MGVRPGEQLSVLMTFWHGDRWPVIILSLFFHVMHQRANCMRNRKVFPRWESPGNMRKLCIVAFRKFTAQEISVCRSPLNETRCSCPCGPLKAVHSTLVIQTHSGKSTTQKKTWMFFAETHWLQISLQFAQLPNMIIFLGDVPMGCINPSHPLQLTSQLFTSKANPIVAYSFIQPAAAQLWLMPPSASCLIQPSRPPRFRA